MTVRGRRNVSAMGLSAMGLLAAVPLWGCGMKGPPRAPLELAPAPVTDLVVQRVGDEVSIGFTLPTANDDRSEPASLERVDVYAMTTRPRLVPDRTLDLEEFQEAATLVASIDVAPPPEPEDEDEPPAEPPPESPPAEDALARQGDPILLTEVLTPETAAPVDPWEEERRRREEAQAEDEDEEDAEEPERPVRAPLMTPLSPGPVQREYVLVHVSTRGGESEGGERIAVPLGVRPPEPPSAPTVVYTETEAEVTWDLPPEVRETVQGPAAAMAEDEAAAADEAAADEAAVAEAAAADEAAADEAAADEAAADEAAADEAVQPPLESRPIVEWPPASTYELFELAGAEAGTPAALELLSPSPLEAPSYTDPRVEYGVERCYAVRTLDVVAGFEVRSRLSPATCVTFVDTFPPAAPQALTAIGSAGEVSLLWRPNEEADVAGYVVLRGSPGDETLQPLMDAPIAENTYLDVTVEPGVRYAYAVRAIDDAATPNPSDPSDRVEAEAR